MSIATKTGDSGETSLMYGRRVSKTDSRVAAYGAVDELNAALGLARASSTDAFVNEQLHAVQKDLIVVMGELATATEDQDRYLKDGFQPTRAAMVERLTALVTELERDKNLYGKGWAIPGETITGAGLDLARTICRRSERAVATLTTPDAAPINPEILRYLNRLSDVCWLLARRVETAASRSDPTP